MGSDLIHQEAPCKTGRSKPTASVPSASGVLAAARRRAAAAGSLRGSPV